MTTLAESVLGIDNVLLEVGDFIRGRHFYGSVLGFAEGYCFPAKKMVGYQIGSEVPGIGLAEVEHPTPATVWFEVADAPALFDELPAEVTVLAPIFDIPTGRVFIIGDEWGNRLGFTDYCHRPEAGRPASA